MMPVWYCQAKQQQIDLPIELNSSLQFSGEWKGPRCQKFIMRLEEKTKEKSAKNVRAALVATVLIQQDPWVTMTLWLRSEPFKVKKWVCTSVIFLTVEKKLKTKSMFSYLKSNNKLSLDYGWLQRSLNLSIPLIKVLSEPFSHAAK